MELRRRPTLEKLSGIFSILLLVLMMFYLWLAATRPESAALPTEPHPVFYTLIGVFLVRTYLDFLWVEIEASETEGEEVPITDLPKPEEEEETDEVTEQARERAKARAAQGLKFFLGLLLIGLLELTWHGHLPSGDPLFIGVLGGVLMMLMLTNYYEGELLRLREQHSERRWINVSYTVLGAMLLLELIFVIGWLFWLS